MLPSLPCDGGGATWPRGGRRPVKPSAAQIPALLANPPADLAVMLIFGADEGLVRERAETVTRAILGGAVDDPFRLAQMSGDEARQDPARLADEYASLSLIGGRRVVRVREAGDALAKTIDYILTLPRGDTLILLESGALDARSALRKSCEAAAHVAAIPCYSDGPAELARLIRETLGGHRIRIDDDSVQYLVAHLGNDRMVTRQELEKLTLLAGDGGTLSFAEVVASIGDSSSLAIDDVVFDALEGNPAGAAEGLDRLFLEGTSAVTILRAALRHGHRLHLAAAQVAAGQSLDAVIRGLRPPVFFKLEPRFRSQLKAWPPRRIERLLSLLNTAEVNCKRTGFPEDTICRQALLSAGRIPMPKG